MPLAFDSINFGKIAFGFFNIDTDMLLLEHYFFFATEFCQCVSNVAKAKNHNDTSSKIKGFSIEQREEIGDLMSAIHGIKYTGFIGDVYKIFPFPKKNKDFKQKPTGWKNRNIIEKIIDKYGNQQSIALKIFEKGRKVEIGEYCFSKETFFQLIEYVWLGGYPRWKDGIRPDYVIKMKNDILNNRWI